MLRWPINLKIAVTNLRATRTRTALTVLGIVIGVASVTIIMALGEGAKNVVRSQITQLGESVLTIRPGKATRDEGGNVTNYNFLAALGASTLTERDLATVEQTESVEGAAPFMYVTGSIAAAGEKGSQGTIIATTEDTPKVLDMRIRAGQFITPEINRNTVVLGQDLAIQLLGSDVAIGQKVALRGQEFTVIGILQRFDASATVTNLIDLNHAAFITLEAGKAFNQGIAQIQQINARATSPEAAKEVALNLHQKLLANHGGEEDFTVLRPEETLQLTDDVFKILTALTGAVASISIIVGGIGIMNIMLVSVTERTREIGIRKAVGATNQQILAQFLIESLVMTLLGGIFGIMFGYAIAFFMGTFLGFMPGVSWMILAIAFGVSIAVGLLFGAWPAIKAARKDSIEALRYFQ